jgi:hypothetical protein
VTICSSVNRVFFMAPSVARGAILSSFSWSENRRAGHQCRATVETLALSKNPPVFARQANIAHGPQQVNNEAALARGGNRIRAEQTIGGTWRTVGVHSGENSRHRQSTDGNPRRARGGHGRREANHVALETLIAERSGSSSERWRKP